MFFGFGLPTSVAGTTGFVVPNTTVATAPGFAGAFPFLFPFGFPGFGGVPASVFGAGFLGVPNFLAATAPFGII